MYKSKKLFSRDEMPPEVSKALVKNFAHMPNDVIVKWELWQRCGFKCVGGTLPYQSKNFYGDEIPYDVPSDRPIVTDKWQNDKRYIIQYGDCIVSDWLYENGAELFESVLIDISW